MVNSAFPGWLFPFCGFFGLLPVALEEDDRARFSRALFLRGLAVALYVASRLLFFHLEHLATERPFGSVKAIITWLSDVVNSFGALVVFFTMALGSKTGGILGVLEDARGARASLLKASGKLRVEDKFDKLLLALVLAFSAVESPLWGYCYWLEIGHGFSRYYLYSFSVNFLCNYAFVAVEVMFVKIVRVISVNLELLNARVTFCFDERVTRREGSDENGPGAVRAAHLRMCRAAAACESAFGPALLLVFAKLFIATVFNPCFLVEAATAPRVRNVSVHSTALFFTLVFFAARLVTLTEACARAKRNSRDTAFHVSRLLSLDLDRAARKEVKYALAQISSEKCGFTVCGLFNIDTPLILSFVGMAFTYILFVVQLA